MKEFKRYLPSMFFGALFGFLFQIGFNDYRAWIAILFEIGLTISYVIQIPNIDEEEEPIKTYTRIFDKNGEYRLDESYTEILKLDKMLNNANIPHTLERFLNGWQIVYSVNGKRIADAVQHYGSYGNKENLLEIMGLVKPEETSDSVLGHLSADDVFRRMSEHYKNCQTEKGGGE